MFVLQSDIYIFKLIQEHNLLYMEKKLRMTNPTLIQQQQQHSSLQPNKKYIFHDSFAA